MDNLISVIIPCYNAEKTIEKCVSSLLKQDYKEIEIIAVNDGSTDGTLEILKRLIEGDNRIKLIDQINSGVSASRNAGLKRVRGDYISFVDADDYVEPIFLSKLIASIEGKDIAICYYSSDFEDRNRSIKVRTVEDVFREMMVPQDNIAAFVWNRLYRFSIIRDNDIRFNENIYACEDTLFNFRYMQYVKSVGICKEHLYHYEINFSSAMFGEGFNEKKITANIAYQYMLEHAKNKLQRQWIEIAAMWFNLILKRQIYNSHYILSSDEMNTINEMLRLNSRAFMTAPISAKYKLAYPVWKLR